MHLVQLLVLPLLVHSSGPLEPPSEDARRPWEFSLTGAMQGGVSTIGRSGSGPLFLIGAGGAARAELRWRALELGASIDLDGLSFWGGARGALFASAGYSRAISERLTLALRALVGATKYCYVQLPARGYFVGGSVTLPGEHSVLSSGVEVELRRRLDHRNLFLSWAAGITADLERRSVSQATTLGGGALRGRFGVGLTL